MEAKDDHTLARSCCLGLPVQTIHKSLELTQGPVFPASTEMDLIFTLESRSKRSGISVSGWALGSVKESCIFSSQKKV